MCECGDANCTDVVQVTIAEYDAIRSVPNRFVLRSGHELIEPDDIVARVNGYLVVERPVAHAW